MTHLQNLIINDTFPKIKFSNDRQTPLISGSDAVDLVKPYLVDKLNENLLCITVTGDRIPITIRIVSIGARQQATLSIPDIMRSVILDGASGMIMVHNHPSGSAKHSDGDLKSMKILESAAETLGISFENSIVISKEGYQAVKGLQNGTSTKTTVTINPMIVALNGLEQIGSTMRPLGLVLLSISVFLLYAEASIGAPIEGTASTITPLILLYPISWAVETVSRILRITLGDTP